MKKEILGLIFFLIIIPSTFSDVIVFDKYTSILELKEDTLIITKNFRLKNIGPSPIIPGEIHFKVSELKGKEPSSPAITNFVVTNSNGKTLDSRQVKKAEEVDLVFTIWDPLLPQFYYDFTMTYEMPFNKKGILFHQITIPFEKTTIPIRKSTTTIKLPSSKHITYAPNAEITKEGKTNIITWEDEEDMKFEYSPLPLTKTGIQMVNLFWITLMIIFIIIFILRVILYRRG